MPEPTTKIFCRGEKAAEFAAACLLQCQCKFSSEPFPNGSWEFTFPNPVEPAFYQKFQLDRKFIENYYEVFGNQIRTPGQFFEAFLAAPIFYEEWNAPSSYQYKVLDDLHALVEITPDIYEEFWEINPEFHQVAHLREDEIGVTCRLLSHLEAKSLKKRLVASKEIIAEYEEIAEDVILCDKCGLPVDPEEVATWCGSKLDDPKVPRWARRGHRECQP